MLDYIAYICYILMNLGYFSTTLFYWKYCSKYDVRVIVIYYSNILIGSVKYLRGFKNI